MIERHKEAYMQVDWDFVKKQIKNYLKSDRILSFRLRTTTPEDIMGNMIKEMDLQLSVRYGKDFTIGNNGVIIAEALNEALADIEEIREKLKSFDIEALKSGKEELEELDKALLELL